MKTKTNSIKPTYTATFEDGEVIYSRRPKGNLFGELPLGAHVTEWPQAGGENCDPWNGAKGVSQLSGRTFVVRRCRPRSGS